MNKLPYNLKLDDLGEYLRGGINYSTLVENRSSDYDNRKVLSTFDATINCSFDRWAYFEGEVNGRHYYSSDRDFSESRLQTKFYSKYGIITIIPVFELENDDVNIKFSNLELITREQNEINKKQAEIMAAAIEKSIEIGAEISKKRSESHAELYLSLLKAFKVPKHFWGGL